MDFTEMTEQARAVRARFADFERGHVGRAWTPPEIMLGFVGDVGDLAKLVQGKSGIRPDPDLDAKMERARISWPFGQGSEADIVRAAADGDEPCIRGPDGWTATGEPGCST